jgi:hypothetical protein
MRKEVLLTALSSVLFIAGCGDLLSLHPLYTEQDRVFDATLEGRWEDKDSLLTVKRDGAAYEVTFQSKKSPKERQEYEMRLVDIAGVRMADLLPTNDMLGHMFVKVRVSGGELGIAFFDSEWLRERVPHENVRVARGNQQAVLIVPTAKVRKLVTRYAGRPQAFGDELVYRRAPGETGGRGEGGPGR